MKVGKLEIHVRSQRLLPRLYLLHWDARRLDGKRDGPDSLLLGFEVSTDYGEPAFEVEVEIPWTRPRPWFDGQLVYWPRKRMGFDDIRRESN